MIGQDEQDCYWMNRKFFWINLPDGIELYLRCLKSC